MRPGALETKQGVQSLDAAAASCFPGLRLLKRRENGLPELRNFNTLELIEKVLFCLSDRVRCYFYSS